MKQVLILAIILALAICHRHNRTSTNRTSTNRTSTKLSSHLLSTKLSSHLLSTKLSSFKGKNCSYSCYKMPMNKVTTQYKCNVKCNYKNKKYNYANKEVFSFKCNMNDKEDKCGNRFRKLEKNVKGMKEAMSLRAREQKKAMFLYSKYKSSINRAKKDLFSFFIREKKIADKLMKK